MPKKLPDMMTSNENDLSSESKCQKVAVLSMRDDKRKVN